MTPEIVGHFLAGVQFLLGDLDADTTEPQAGVEAATPVTLSTVTRRREQHNGFTADQEIKSCAVRQKRESEDGEGPRMPPI